MPDETSPRDVFESTTGILDRVVAQAADDADISNAKQACSAWLANVKRVRSNSDIVELLVKIWPCWSTEQVLKWAHELGEGNGIRLRYALREDGYAIVQRLHDALPENIPTLSRLVGKSALSLMDLVDSILQSDRQQAPSKDALLFGGYMNMLSREFRNNLFRITVTLAADTEQLPSSVELPRDSITFTQLLENRAPVAVASGGVGDIYRGIYNGYEVALKTLRRYTAQNLGTPARGRDKCFYREVAILRGLEHKNICWTFGVYENRAQVPGLCLVMPWCNHNHVKLYMDEMGWSEGLTLRLILESLAGVTYLHHMGVVHGDLHPENILIDQSGHVKLADFGLSNFVSSTEFSNSMRRPGVARYMAPEVHFPDLFVTSDESRSKHTCASDMYSFGQLCWKIFTGLDPLHGLSNTEGAIFLRIASIQTMPVGKMQPRELSPHEIPGYLWDTMETCWEWEPAKRPEAHYLYPALADAAGGLARFASAPEEAVDAQT